MFSMNNQAKVDARVLTLKGNHPEYNSEQLTGIIMLELNIFYNDAKPMVELALVNLNT